LLDGQHPSSAASAGLGQWQPSHNTAAAWEQARIMPAQTRVPLGSQSTMEVIIGRTRSLRAALPCLASAQRAAHLDDLLHHVAVIVPDVAGVHFHVVVAGYRGQLHLQLAVGQLDLPGLRLHLRGVVTASGHAGKLAVHSCAVTVAGQQRNVTAHIRGSGDSETSAEPASPELVALGAGHESFCCCGTCSHGAPGRGQSSQW
jgi:hypothetical protein